MLLAASWGWQDTPGAASCFREAMQLQGGRGMPSLHSSASSARAPERFISSKWMPLMNQLKLIKSSGVPSRWAGLALDAAALPQPALGKIGSCFRLQHP